MPRHRNPFGKHFRRRIGWSSVIGHTSPLQQAMDALMQSHLIGMTLSEDDRDRLVMLYRLGADLLERGTR